MIEMTQKHKMSVPFSFGEGFETFMLNQIDTGTEKHILEFATVMDDPEFVFETVCRMFGIPEELPDELKMVLIYKIREISFGPDMELLWTCPKCKQTADTTIMIEDLMHRPSTAFLSDNRWYDYVEYNGNLDPVRFTDLWKFFTVINIEELKRDERFRDIQFDESDISLQFLKHLTPQEGKNLLLYITLKRPTPKEYVDGKCIVCGEPFEIDILNKEGCLNSLSEHKLLGLYKIYSSLVYGGKFSKADIDSMLPFEREIHLGLLNKRKQDKEER